MSPRISIHAPTRGATVHISGNFTVAMISIHAPTRGATKYRVCAFTVHRFQSTLPRGERHCPETLVYLVRIRFQSTLPRGERLLGFFSGTARDEFQSTLPRGERHYVSLNNIQSVFVFQSTLPRGERPGQRKRYEYHNVDFNPRSHEGSDSWRSAS